MRSNNGSVYGKISFVSNIDRITIIEKITLELLHFCIMVKAKLCDEIEGFDEI